MIDLLNEPEIFPYDKVKGQILTEDSYVENAHVAIGFASRCWKDSVFDTEEALRIANELCAYIRLLKEGRGE